MAIQRNIVISVTVLLTLFEIGSCLRCYECTSQKDQSCADPYRRSNNHIHDCIFGDQCGKSILETPEGDVTERQCFNTLNHCETFIYKSHAATMNAKIKHCSSCHGDLCNGSSTVSLPISLTILTLFAICLYYK